VAFSCPSEVEESRAYAERTLGRYEPMDMRRLMSPRHVMVKRLREYRAKRGLSRREPADLSGVSREYIARIELGQHDPTLSTLEKIANALGVKVSKLID
jgi:DNA-binding XRE family transcriptional regulator